MTTGRRLLVVSMALVALLMLAIALSIALFDVNRYKPEIEEAVLAHTGRTLQLNGDLALSFFPTLAIDLPASTLSARDSEADFLGFASARIAIAPLPLLRQELLIESIELREARATVTRQASDSKEVARAAEVSRETGQNGAVGDTPSAPGDGTTARPETGWEASWEIGHLLLSNATITLHDAASERTLVLSAVNLETGRLAPKTQLPLALKAQVAASKPELAGALEVTATLDVDLASSALAASDLKLSFTGTHDRQASRASVSASRLSRQGDTISASQLALHAGGQRGAEAWTLAGSAERFSIDSQTLDSGAIEASVTLAGAQPVDARLKLDSIAGPRSLLVAENVLLTATRRDGPATRYARVGGRLNTNLDERTLTLPQLTGEIALEDPLLPEGQARLPLAGALTVDGEREQVRLKLASRAADASFEATIELTKFAQPEIGFDLQADRINLDRYLPPVRQIEVAAAANAARRSARQAAGHAPGHTRIMAGRMLPISTRKPVPTAAEPGFDLAPLRKLQLDGKLQIAQLQAHGIQAASVRASVHSAGGRATVAPLSARLYGGRADGDLTLDAEDQRVSLNLALNDVDFGAMACDALTRSDLSGRGNIDLTLSSAGRSRAELTRAAQGTARFALRDVALVGIDLAAVLDQLKEVLSGGGTQSGKIDRSRRTLLSHLSATVKLADGIARNDDLDGAAPTLALGGYGQFDLLANELDYTLRVMVAARSAPSSKLLRALESFPVPVHVSGPSDELRYSISLQDVAADVLARYRADVGPTLVDEAKRFLGELFGGDKRK